MSAIIKLAELEIAKTSLLNGNTDPFAPVTTVSIKPNKISVLSYFGDDIWELPYNIFSSVNGERKLNFLLCPSVFKDKIKQIMISFYLKGTEGKGRPTGGTCINVFKAIRHFLGFIYEQYDIKELNQINSFHCIQYAEFQKSRTSKTTKKKLSKQYVTNLFMAVETLQHLSLLLEDKMKHPWPDTSAKHLAGNTRGLKSSIEGKTKIIPDDILGPLFQKSVDYIENADALIKMIDGLASQRVSKEKLQKLGWLDGVHSFNFETERTLLSCAIIILTTTGIRIHELGYIGAGRYDVKTNKNGSYYSTVQNDERYYWLRTRSDKTKEGYTSFLCTELTHKAIKIAEKLTAQNRVKLIKQIEVLQLNDPENQLIPEKNSIKNLVFLNERRTGSRDVEVIRGTEINDKFNAFMKYIKLDWKLSPHQFRRTFAIYVAKSAHGDLRYLKQHFKHWSLDMTMLYALDTNQEEDLYQELILSIETERNAKVMSWFEEDTLITGGGSEGIKVYRSKNEEIKNYTQRKSMIESISETIHIRATGTAWCTADDGGCGGGSAADPTRCGSGCSNSIIDQSLQKKWEGIYAQQIELLNIDDIGLAGKDRVLRDVARCKDVLTGLGVDLSTLEVNTYER